jgi:hypothetical protein
MKQTAMDVLRDAVNLIDSVRVGFSPANERKAEKIIAAYDRLASPQPSPQSGSLSGVLREEGKSGR